MSWKPLILWIAVSTALVATSTSMAEESSIPPVPPSPTTFLAPADDPAGRVARILSKRFRAVPNQRARVRGQWIVDPAAVWQIRSQADCLAALDALGVEATVHHYSPVPIATPVVLHSKVRGVVFRKTRHDADFIVSCELAARLPTIAEIVRRYGVHTVDVLSSYRREPLSSYHTAGLGLDIDAFHAERGEINVLHHFVNEPGHLTCYGPTRDDWRAQTLLNIACDLANSHQFSTVITPSYGRGHDDHFHIDARPNDPRIYMR